MAKPKKTEYIIRPLNPHYGKKPYIDITEEEYAEVVRTGMWKGKPQVLQRRCSGCGTPIGQNNKPPNLRLKTTGDDRCYACVEVPIAQARLANQIRKRKIRLVKMQLLKRKRFMLQIARRVTRYRKRRAAREAALGQAS